MTFHEKSAWVMGILLLLVGGWYLNTVWQTSVSLGETAPPMMHLIGRATLILIIGAIVGHIVIAVWNLKDANDEKDERDKQVLRKSGHVSGFVLGFGCVTGLVHYVVRADGNLLFHMVVVSLIAAHIVEYALTIFFYRRGG